MNSLAMRFPVLRMNERHVRRFKSNRELQTMTERYFDAGSFMKGAFFIDADGKRYSIERVTKRRRSWHVSFWFAPSPAIIVDVVVGSPVQLSFGEIKQLIVDLVAQNGWYRQGGESEQEFRTAFEGFQSTVELIDNVSFYGEWQG